MMATWRKLAKLVQGWYRGIRPFRLYGWPPSTRPTWGFTFVANPSIPKCTKECRASAVIEWFGGAGDRDVIAAANPVFGLAVLPFAWQ